MNDTTKTESAVERIARLNRAKATKNGWVTDEENCRRVVVAFPSEPIRRHSADCTKRDRKEPDTCNCQVESTGISAVPLLDASETPVSARSDSGVTTSQRPPTVDHREEKRREVGVLMPHLVIGEPLSGYRSSDVGKLTHAVVEMLAGQARHMEPWMLSERILDLSGSFASHANSNRRRVLITESASLSGAYLRRYLPPLPWRLLGTEYPLPHSRVDLAWEHPNGTVFFDEIKTTRSPVLTLQESWLTQCSRHVEGGNGLHGKSFVGVRLIPLGSLHLVSLVTSDGVSSLSPAPGHPLGLADLGDQQ